MTFNVNVPKEIEQAISEWELPERDRLAILLAVQRHLSETPTQELGTRVVAPVRYVVTHVTCETSIGLLRLTIFVDVYRDPTSRFILDISYRTM